MVQFAIQTQCPNWPIAVVAAHGLTDCIRGPWLLSYALLVVPLPGWAVTTAFAAASLAHFAVDVGWAASVVGHLMLTGLYAASKDALAFGMLMAYMVLVHVPGHYGNVYEKEFGEGAVGVAALATLALAVWPPWRGVFHIDHLAQRLVVSHVLCNLSEHPLQHAKRRWRWEHA